LINHLRIPGGVPNDEGRSYLDQVKATAKACGGEWLAQGDVRVLEGAWAWRGGFDEISVFRFSWKWRGVLPLR